MLWFIAIHDSSRYTTHNTLYRPSIYCNNYDSYWLYVYWMLSLSVKFILYCSILLVCFVVCPGNISHLYQIIWLAICFTDYNYYKHNQLEFGRPETNCRSLWLLSYDCHNTHSVTVNSQHIVSPVSGKFCTLFHVTIAHSTVLPVYIPHFQFYHSHSSN